LTTGSIAAAHKRFNGIRQVAPVYTQTASRLVKPWIRD